MTVLSVAFYVMSVLGPFPPIVCQHVVHYFGSVHGPYQYQQVDLTVRGTVMPPKSIRFDSLPSCCPVGSTSTGYRQYSSTDRLSPATATATQAAALYHGDKLQLLVVCVDPVN